MNLVSSLFEVLRNKYPNYAKVWANALEANGPEWESDFSRHIERVFGGQPGERWMEAVDGYAEFCTEALRAQVFYEKHGRYQASNYDEVARLCYHDADYMTRRYLPGQFLSHYVWPHHFKMLHHFTDDLLPEIRDDVELFFEVGVGCGMYSLQTLEKLPECSGVGYDISCYATEFTERVVLAHDLGARYAVANEDIMTVELTRLADFIVNQEVLEHLEAPDEFVKGLYAMVRPGGWGYITAAINAAHTDHIYLYRSPGEVEEHLKAAGWITHDVQVESNYPEKPEQFRPTIAGFLVRRPD